MGMLSAMSRAESQPSFDCHRARSRVEHIICSSAKLSRLDQSLADTYQHALTTPTVSHIKITESQQMWLHARSGVCIAPADWAPLFSEPISDNPADCLAILYTQRIDELHRGSSYSTYWRAESKTAYSITADILLSTKTVILGGGHRIQISFIRTIPQSHAMADLGFDDANTLQLFKINEANPLKLIRGNTLCGPDNVATYIVLAETHQNRNLSMAIFEGATEPRWEKSFLENTRSLCGTYGFTRDIAKP
jgi:uncharacterized protein YecT (DUF1311 family)